MPDLLFLELALLGLCSGFLAGLLGVGGGMVLVPFLAYFLGKRGGSPGIGVLATRGPVGDTNNRRGGQGRATGGGAGRGNNNSADRREAAYGVQDVGLA